MWEGGIPVNIGEIIPSLVKASCIVLGITLLLAGYSKLRAPSAFIAVVLEYKILPTSLARSYGRWLPIAEMSIGILLIAGIWVNLLAFVSALIFSSFLIAVSINIFRKRDLSCFCFGQGSSLIGWHTIGRIILLFSISVFLVFTASDEKLILDLMLARSTSAFIEYIPIFMIVAFGLAVLSIIEVAPEIVRAWTAKAVRPPHREAKGIWRSE